MAISNRDRIGQMFDVLSAPLDAFISASVDSQISEGASWTGLVEARDLKKGIEGKAYDAGDVQVQLRMLTENIAHQVKPGWYPFDGKLSRPQQSYASELREVRDSWAHMKSFSDDDAYRALDTAERLLLAVNAADAATEVSKIRLNLRRMTAERDDRRTLKNAADTPESAGLRPWRDVLQPHADVATGRFQAIDMLLRRHHSAA